jgi:hypothetical protein
MAEAAPHCNCKSQYSLSVSELKGFFQGRAQCSHMKCIFNTSSLRAHNGVQKSKSNYKTEFCNPRFEPEWISRWIFPTDIKKKVVGLEETYVFTIELILSIFLHLHSQMEDLHHRSCYCAYKCEWKTLTKFCTSIEL